MEDCYAASMPMAHDLKITNELVENSTFVIKYQALVGSLQFLATYTRVNIAFAAGFLGRFNNAPTQQCWLAALNVLQYLKETLDYGITFDGSKGYRLVAYSDAD